MTKKGIISLIVGIIFLIVPTTVYLVFLIPKMAEEYIVLMSSAGIIGSSGTFASTKIPDNFSHSGLLKTSSRLFSLLVVLTLVQDFLPQIIWLAFVVAVSFIIFKICKGVFDAERRKKQNRELSTEITRSIVENIE